MDRKKTTGLLGDMLIRDVLGKKHYSSEVTFNFGRPGQHRVDFMAFEPVNQTTSGIEHGRFTAYEIKSCLADYRSANGHNLYMDKNYYVMPMELYKKVVNELPYYAGAYCPVHIANDMHEEFADPTKTEDLRLGNFELRCIKCAHNHDRDISNSVALFCMLRSG